MRVMPNQKLDFIFEVLNEKLRPQHINTVLSQQYCKLRRYTDEMADWIGRLRIKTTEYRWVPLKPYSG